MPRRITTKLSPVSTTLLRCETLEERTLLSASGVDIATSACATPYSPAYYSNGVLNPSPIELGELTAPTNVAARSFGCENIVLTWEHATNASYYYIETSPDAESAWTVIANGLHGSTAVVSAPIDSSNYYRIVAVASDGATCASGALVASPAPLGVPENLTATAFERLAVQLNWIAPTTDEFPLYAIERSHDGGATWTTVAENYAGTNWCDRSLTLGDTASYRVSIIAPSGARGATCEPVSYTIPYLAPDAPIALATLQDTGEVLVEWSEPQCADSYSLERSEDGLVWTELGASLVGTSYLDAPQDVATVLYRARARNAAGASDYSRAVHATPAQTRALWLADRTTDALELNWTPGANNLRYRIERSFNGDDWTLVATSEPNATSWLDADLTRADPAPGDSVVYRVSSLSSFGAVSQPRLLTVNGDPTELELDAPDPPTATPLSPIEIELTWLAVEDATYYQIERSGDDGATWLVLDENVDALEYLDDDVEPGETYLYRLAARADATLSEYSDATEVAAPSRPLASPDAPYAVPQTSTSIYVSWRAIPDVVSRLERSGDEGVSWQSLELTAGATNYLDANLTADSEYLYRVTYVSTTGQGISAPSRETTTRTCSTLAAPCAPTASAITLNGATLAWSATPTAAQYEIWRESDYEEPRLIATVSSTTLTYADQGLQSDVHYVYRLRAVDANGAISVFSSPTTVLTNCVAPETPTELSTYVLSATEVYLEWNGDVSATSYTIERSLDGSTWTVVANDCVDEYYIDDNLAPVTTYYYRVSALNRAGASQATTGETATTLPAPDAYEPNNSIFVIESPSAAANLGLLTCGTSLLNLTYVGDEDYYRFEMNATGGSTDGVTLIPPVGATDLTFDLLDADGELVASAVNNAVSLEGVEPGAYNIRVYSDDVDAVYANYILTIVAPYRPVVATAPTNLTCASDAPYSVSVTWSEAFGALDYELQRSLDGLVWTTTATGLEELEWSEADLAANTTYYYRVGASFLNSEVRFWSSAVSVTTQMEDDELLANDSQAEIDAQLARYSNGGYLGDLTESTSYHGLAAPIGDEDWFAFNLTSRRADATVALDYDANVAAPTLELRDTTGALVRTGVVDSGTITLNISSLTSGRYYARVVAPSSGLASYDLAFDPGAPDLPAITSVVATELTGGGVAVTWQGIADAEWYCVERAPGATPSADDWAPIAQGITDANYVDSSALSGASYSYRVSAYREGTYSSNLTSGVGVLTTAATIPDRPTGFSALRYGDEYVVATWKPSYGATSYTVLRSTDGCQTWPYVATVYDASYIDDDIEPGVTYVYRLRANNSAGHSAWTFVSGYGFGTTPASLTNGLDPTTDVALPGYDVAFTRGSNPSGLVDATLAAREGSAIVKQSAQDGTVTLNATTGAWSYAPSSATVVNGVTSGALDLFSIETFDSDGVSQDETYVIVEAPDEPAPYAPSSTPVARADSFVVINIRTLGALSPVVLDPLENDSATSTGTLTLVSATLSDPNAGTLAVGQDSRSLEFYPAQGFTGDVSFSYTVSDSASNATTNGASSLRVTAPPSAWQPGVLALGATTVAGSPTIPTSIAPTFADGSYSFVITDSADVDGVHYSATLSVVVYDRGGVYRYHETRSWTYGYVSGAISYSGGIDSDYGYSLSPVRESLKYKVSGRDVAYCRSGSQTGTLTETNDYVYTASEVNGTFRDSTYSKRTRNETGTTTTLGEEVLYGESVRVRSDAFHTSFENAIQTHETVLGVESGHYRGLGRERALVLTSGKKDVAVNDRVWEDGLTTARVGSTRINYSDTSQTTTHYTLSQDWNGNGWGVAVGSGQTTGEGTTTTSVSGSGATTLSSYLPSETRNASGTFSESATSTQRWDETVTFTPSATGWAIANGTGGGSLTATNSAQTNWSGTYSRGQLTGATLGATSESSTTNKTYGKAIANGEWQLTSGSGTESGSATSESTDVSGNYSGATPTLLGAAGITGAANGSERIDLAPGAYAQFATTSTEYKKRATATNYTVTHAWTNGDWSIVGVGTDVSSSRVIAETSGQNGVYVGASGETGNDGTLYRGQLSTEDSNFAIVYNPTTEEWRYDAGYLESTSTSESDFGCTGAGYQLSAEATAFFDGNASIQGSGVAISSGLFSASASSSASRLDFTYDATLADLALSQGSWTEESSSAREGRTSSRTGAFSRSGANADYWNVSARSANDSANAAYVRSVWDGSDWNSIGIASNREQTDGAMSSSLRKTTTGQDSSNGPTWNQTTTSTQSSGSTNQSASYFYMTLDSTGTWRLAPYETIASELASHTPTTPSLRSDFAPTFGMSPTLNQMGEATTQTSNMTSSAESALVAGVANGVNYTSGESSSEETQTSSVTSGSTSTLELPTGATVYQWRTLATEVSTGSKTNEGESSVSYNPSDCSGNATDAESNSSSITYTITRAFDSHDVQNLATSAGWRYASGSREESSEESKTKSLAFSKATPSSHNTTFDRNINWNVRTGESSTESTEYLLVLTLAPGKNLVWQADTEAEGDENRPGVNYKTETASASLFDEYATTCADWDEPTDPISAGQNAPTYVVENQNVSQLMRFETGLSGGRIVYHYTDANGWKKQSQNGELTNRVVTSYSASSDGTYTLDDISGTFSTTKSRGLDMTSVYNWFACTGVRTTIETESETINYAESGAIDGGTLSNELDSSYAATTTVVSNVNLLSVSDQLVGSRLSERYDALADGRWEIATLTVVGQVDSNSNLSYEKTVARNDAGSYLQAPSGLSLDSFSGFYNYNETDDLHYAVNYTLEYDSTLERFKLADGYSGVLSRDYSKVADEGYRATGHSVADTLTMTPSGTVTRDWGSCLEDKIHYSCELQQDENLRGYWSITSEKPEAWNTFSLEGLNDRFNDTVVGIHSESDYDEYSFVAESGLFSSTYTSANVKERNSSESGYFWRVKDNGLNSFKLAKVNNYSVTHVKIDRDYVEKTPSSILGVILDSNASTTIETGFHIQRTLGGYYDGAGAYHALNPTTQYLGAAYRNEKIVCKTTQPYSRYYDNSNTGVVSGTLSGYGVNDRIERSCIDATVFYNAAQNQTFYVGVSMVNKEIKQSYSGSGSYNSTGPITRVSSFSESGTAKEKSKTKTYYDTDRTNSAISVDHTSQETSTSSYGYALNYATGDGQS